LNVGTCGERICALRAPTVFSARMKSISAQENTVMLKSKDSVGFLYKIADSVRVCFSSAR
jgi:hypothetical protein